MAATIRCVGQVGVGYDTLPSATEVGVAEFSASHLSPVWIGPEPCRRG